MKQADEHNYWALFLDSELSFSADIKAAIPKTRKGISQLNISQNISLDIH